MFGYKIGFINTSTTGIANRMGLLSLAKRRKYFAVVSVYKLLRGKTNCKKFLSLIGISRFCI